MNPEWLSFISTLIWQAIVVAMLVAFHRELRALFERISSVDLPGGGKAVFHQQQSLEAAAPSGEAAVDLDLDAHEGFLSSTDLIRLVEGSGLVSTDERGVATLLLFKTDAQQTWLVATDRHLFCVLDDEDTRASRRLIQWRMSLDDAQPVRTRPHRKSVGLIDIGSHTDWLYSRSLHPSGHRLEREVQDLVKSARLTSASR